MAAGVPLVVSDWNGYRDLVRNGIDGFRVPTRGHLCTTSLRTPGLAATAGP